MCEWLRRATSKGVTVKGPSTSSTVIVLGHALFRALLVDPFVHLIKFSKRRLTSFRVILSRCSSFLDQ